MDVVSLAFGLVFLSLAIGSYALRDVADVDRFSLGVIMVGCSIFGVWSLVQAVAP